MLDYDTMFEPYDMIHKDYLVELDHLKDWMLGVVEATYQTGDVEEFERCLGEACAIMNLKLPMNKPMLRIE